MASQTDICNAALILLGADSINAITDNANSARALNAVWNLTRDTELRKHIWKFSIARAQLPALATAPVNGPYNAAFELPADCIRVLQVGDANYDYPAVDLSDYRSGPTNDDWQIEGGTVLTNYAAPISVRYCRLISDPTQWDGCFAAVMAAGLAAATCFRITQSTAQEKVAIQAYQMAIRDAVRVNALETPPQQQADDSWVATRPVGAGGAAWIRYG